jgi:ectoine hydroxylase-related dioxygenase (phytanoyl-CoA dioxygenase family)
LKDKALAVFYRWAQAKMPENQGSQPFMERLASSFAISRSQAAHFSEFGFVAIDNIASSREVASIRAAIAGLFEAKTGFREGSRFNLLGAGAPSVTQLLGPHQYFQELAQTEFFANASTVARQLLGERAQFMVDHAILKPAINGPALPWHQDEAFRHPAFEHKEISIWLPLQPVEGNAGCMAYIPKSHLGDVLPHQRVGRNMGALECIEVDADSAVICPIPVGACIVHAGRTIHGSGPNLSDQPRYAYVLIFRLPPVGSLRLRKFPWRTDTQTPRMLRERAWRLRSREMIMLWRIIRTHPTEIWAILWRRLWIMRYNIIMICRR